MQRYGSVVGVNPEKKAEYIRLHAAVWPDILRMISECNIRNYSIWLDMLFQAQMVDLLRELQRKRDLTYMFISHDLRVVASLASHLIVMRHGKVVEEGPASELFKNPKSDYTRALFAAAFRLETAPDGPVAG